MATTTAHLTKGTAAILVGLAGLVTASIPPIGLTFGVAAIALGAASRKDLRGTGRAMAWPDTLGLALGAVAVAGSIALLIASSG